MKASTIIKSPFNMVQTFYSHTKKWELSRVPITLK